jgi:hypothetical protein
VVLAPTIAVSTTVSVGYVIWMIRGGVLLSSLLSSMPAWQLIDPLPVLPGFGEKVVDDEQQGESLHGLISKGIRHVQKMTSRLREST